MMVEDYSCEFRAHHRLVLCLSRKFKCQTTTARNLCPLEWDTSQSVHFLCNRLRQFSGQRDQFKLLIRCCHLILCHVLFLHFLYIFFVIVCFLDAIIL